MTDIVYPSGLRLDAVPEELAGSYYADAPGGAVVPLVSVAQAGDAPLSPDFSLRHFLRGVPAECEYARVSVTLVKFLQRVQDAAAGPMTIVSGYRPDTTNTRIRGADKSPHISGLAVDFKVSGMTPLETAVLALDEARQPLGIGLGAGTIHVELREDMKTWVYVGSPLTADAFAEWVASRATTAP